LHWYISTYDYLFAYECARVNSFLNIILYYTTVTHTYVCVCVCVCVCEYDNNAKEAKRAQTVGNKKK